MPRRSRKRSNLSRFSASSMAATPLPSDLKAGVVERAGQVDGRLSAELGHDGRGAAVGALVAQHLGHALFVQRFKVEAGGRVEVGAYRFRIGVDEHAFTFGVFQSPRGMNGAIVELDALSDANRTAAEHNGGRLAADQGFVLGFVGAPEIGRCSVKLGRAGVDHLEGWTHAGSFAQLKDALRQGVAERGDHGVGESLALGVPDQIRRQRLGQQAAFGGQDVGELVEEEDDRCRIGG